MDQHVMHNIIHRDYGSESSKCPVCNGSLKSKDEITQECNSILKRQQMMNYMVYSEKKGIKAGEQDTLRVHTAYAFDEDGKLPDEIMLVPTGKWNTTKYGEVEITKKDIEQMKLNFDNNIRKGVMIDVDHGSSSHGDAAAGWIKKVEVRDDGLWCTELEWTPLGKELVEGKIYKFLSPEFDVIHVDPQDKSKIMENVLIATSLVNRPLLREIPALTFSEEAVVKNLTNNTSNVMMFIEPMDVKAKIDQILNTPKEQRSSDDVKFLEDNKQSFSEEQTTRYTAETTTKEEPKGNPAPVTTVTANEGKTVSMSEDEAKKLREDAAAGRAAFQEMEKNRINTEYGKLKFSENGGKLPPAAFEDDKIANLVITLNAEQRKLFDEIVNALPDRKMFGESGSDEAVTPSVAADQLTAEVSQYAKDNNMKFSEAFDAMQKSDPEKFANYRNNLTPSK